MKYTFGGVLVGCVIYIHIEIGWRWNDPTRVYCCIQWLDSWTGLCSPLGPSLWQSELMDPVFGGVRTAKLLHSNNSGLRWFEMVKTWHLRFLAVNIDEHPQKMTTSKPALRSSSTYLWCNSSICSCQRFDLGDIWGFLTSHGGTPNGLFLNGKFYQNGWFRRTSILGNLHICIWTIIKKGGDFFVTIYITGKKIDYINDIS